MSSPELTAASAGREPKPKPGRRAKPRQLIKAGLVGGLFGLIVTAVVLVLIYRRDLPRIDRQTYDAAKKRWADNAVPDYNVTVEVKLHQLHLYEVQVRAGEVVAVRVDGRDLKRRHAFETWSVPGMFETLARDLKRKEALGSRQGAFGKESKVILRGKFHERYGYPTSILRIETREKGSNPEVAWTVKEFQVLEPGETDLPRTDSNN